MKRSTKLYQLAVFDTQAGEGGGRVLLSYITYMGHYEGYGLEITEF